jgi:hypothetical protein
VLVAWLRSSPNYAEIGAWYSQWKSLLPAVGAPLHPATARVRRLMRKPQDVLENGTVQHFMSRALTLISMHVQVRDGGGGDVMVVVM